MFTYVQTDPFSNTTTTITKWIGSDFKQLTKNREMMAEIVLSSKL